MMLAICSSLAVWLALFKLLVYGAMPWWAVLAPLGFLLVWRAYIGVLK